MPATEQERRVFGSVIEKARGALDDLRRKIDSGDDWRVQETDDATMRQAIYHFRHVDGKRLVCLTVYTEVEDTTYVPGNAGRHQDSQQLPDEEIGFGPHEPPK